MRTFDYRHLPSRLFDGKVGDANVRVYEDKGKLEFLERDHAEFLESLRGQAHYDNVDSSAHIEGLYIGTERVCALLDGAEPTEEVEAQIAGYSRTLDLIERNSSALDLSTATILKLFESMYAHRELGRKSRYRKKDYLYVQVDGHPQAMPVSPITAFETPLVLGGACDSLADAFIAEACSPLILNAVFTVDFLCIRPFDEGNGRIARLFAALMLEKAGFNVGRYVSIDRIIEKTAMEYYDALNACVEGWDRARNDYAPYALYWLHVLHEAYRQLFEKFDGQAGPRRGKTERVRSYVLSSAKPVTKREVHAALPDVSEATIEAALGALVREGAVSKVGAGRSTAYLVVSGSVG